MTKDKETAQRIRATFDADRLRKMYGCDIEKYDHSVETSFTFQTIGAWMVLMSELSDVQELVAMGDKEAARQLLNRVKHLIDRHVPKPPRVKMHDNDLASPFGKRLVGVLSVGDSIRHPSWGDDKFARIETIEPSPERGRVRIGFAGDLYLYEDLDVEVEVL
jgi:hypothetical protein